jgi:hypothetical protein
LTGVQINELDPGIDAVRSSTEHTQGHLHSTRVPGPDSSGYGIFTFFQIRTEQIGARLDTVHYFLGTYGMQIMSRIKCSRIRDYTEPKYQIRITLGVLRSKKYEFI